MADNVTLQSATPATPPAATVLATDDVSGVHYPRSKLDGGGDGASVPILSGGGVEASALRVTIASDSTGVLSVDDNGATLSVDDGAGSLTVDSPQLPAALAAGGGMKVEGVAGGVAVPVSAATLPLPSGAATAAKQPALGTAGTSSTDVLSVQGIASGTALPVSAASLPLPSGAATSAAQTTAQTALDAIKTAVELIDNTVGGTELQVDVVGALPAGTNAIGKLAANSGVDIGDVDVTSVTPGTAAASLGKAEDAAHASGDVGVMALGVRKDTGAAIAGTDGDYSPFQMDANGNLRVAVVTGGGTGGTSATDDAAFTPASGSGTPIMGFADETGPDAVDEGDVGVVRMTLQRGLHVNLRDSAGAEVSVGGGTQYNEDDAETGAGKVTMAGVVRRDTAASGVSADGDVAFLCVDSTGKLHVNVGNTVTVASHAVTNAGTFAVQVSSALPAGTNNIGDVDVLTVPTDPFGANADAASATGSISAKLRFIAATGIPITGTVTVGSHAVTNAGTFAVQAASAGDVAHDSADSGNPVKLGAKAKATLSGVTLVAADDRTDLFADLDGALIVRPYAPLGGIVSGNASNTDGTNTQCIAAQASGIKTYLTTIILTNTSATMTFVEIKDGSTTKLTIPVPATGGATVNLPAPLPGTAATAWNFDPGAATTTIYCSMVGFTSKA